MKKRTKRTKRIEILTTDEEYQQLLERKTKTRLAEWLRELALNEKKITPPTKTDPLLLSSLNKIGNNLNQIARFLNQNKSSIPSDKLVEIAVSLANIEEHLKDIKLK